MLRAGINDCTALSRICVPAALRPMSFDQQSIPSSKGALHEVKPGLQEVRPVLRPHETVSLSLPRGSLFANDPGSSIDRERAIFLGGSIGGQSRGAGPPAANRLRASRCRRDSLSSSSKVCRLLFCWLRRKRRWPSSGTKLSCGAPICTVDSSSRGSRMTSSVT